MSGYEGAKRSIVGNLANKTKTLQFEIRSKDTVVSVEDGIAKCSLLKRNIIALEFDERDLGGTISKVKSLEVLNTYNSFVVSKSFEYINGLVLIEIEMAEDLVIFPKEVLAEIRLVYKLR